MSISRKEAISKGINKYFTGKPCKRGHVSERYTSNSDCVQCSIDRAMGVHSGTPIEEVYQRAKERRLKNIEKYRISERRYYKENAQKFRDSSKAYYHRNKHQCRERHKAWESRNRDKIREHWKYSSERRRSSPEGKLVCGLRSRISAMAAADARSKTAEQYLGCTMEDFKRHLESMFTEGMNWDNYGREGWQIDHVRPLSSFDLSDENEISVAFHYSNTQPMWAKENQKKGAKWQV